MFGIYPNPPDPIRRRIRNTIRFLRMGFGGWDWVGKGSFVGQVEKDGVQCLAFVPGGATKLQGDDLSESLKTQSHVAYVDAATKLPQAFRNGTVVQNFRFEAQAPVLQELPETRRTDQKTEQSCQDFCRRRPDLIDVRMLGTA